MRNTQQDQNGSTTWVDHIPVIWFEPQIHHPQRQLIIFLHHFNGTKESTIPFLKDLAVQGFVALSFDAWQHGERGVESQEEISKRVFGNFRHHMWTILGHTTLDTLRIIDWAVATLNVMPCIYMGGLSMGGDIAVAAAGIDHRIKRIVAVVATPDWLRPGMEDAFHPGTPIPTGKPDRYAQYFYDRLNPLTNLTSYSHNPTIDFICGEEDTHVPPDGAIRFQSVLRETYPASAIKIHLIPRMRHMDVRDPKLWWPDCSVLLTRERYM
jgi:dienelactone hydrolase